MCEWEEGIGNMKARAGNKRVISWKTHVMLLHADLWINFTVFFLLNLHYIVGYVRSWTRLSVDAYTHIGCHTIVFHTLYRSLSIQVTLFENLHTVCRGECPCRGWTLQYTGMLVLRFELGEDRSSLIILHIIGLVIMKREWVGCPHLSMPLLGFIGMHCFILYLHFYYSSLVCDIIFLLLEQNLFFSNNICDDPPAPSFPGLFLDVGLGG